VKALLTVLVADDHLHYMAWSGQHATVLDLTAHKGKNKEMWQIKKLTNTVTAHIRLHLHVSLHNIPMYNKSKDMIAGSNCWHTLST
jgi:hypothetical protein